MQQVQVNTVKPELSFFENESLNRLLNFEGEEKLDTRIRDIENYMSNNSGVGLSELEKDDLYAQAQSLLTELKKELRDVKFTFYLNRPQYNFLTNLLLTKIEYDINTVFIGLELMEFLSSIANSKYANDTDIKGFDVDATELTYMYHLIQPHKVKGLTKDAHTFSRLLVRIGEVSKVVNYYDAMSKKLVDEISQWALKMDAVKGEAVAPTIEKVEEEPETQF